MLQAGYFLFFSFFHTGHLSVRQFQAWNNISLLVSPQIQVLVAVFCLILYLLIILLFVLSSSAIGVLGVFSGARFVRRRGFFAGWHPLIRKVQSLKVKYKFLKTCYQIELNQSNKKLIISTLLNYTNKIHIHKNSIIINYLGLSKGGDFVIG